MNNNENIEVKRKITQITLWLKNREWYLRSKLVELEREINHTKIELVIIKNIKQFLLI